MLPLPNENFSWGNFSRLDSRNPTFSGEIAREAIPLLNFSSLLGLKLDTLGSTDSNDPCCNLTYLAVNHAASDPIGKTTLERLSNDFQTTLERLSNDLNPIWRRRSRVGVQSCRSRASRKRLSNDFQTTFERLLNDF